MRITSVNSHKDAQIDTVDLLQFSPGERDILTYLDKAEGITSKEDMGTIIWKNKVKEKYSEWALDQRVARLRKKLMDTK
jgi:DNA-binding winged helix-turn-helix (wHTH) protein